MIVIDLDNPPEEARLYVEHYERIQFECAMEFRRLRRVAGTFEDNQKLLMELIAELRTELNDTRRERNRNREYVGEAHRLMTEYLRWARPIPYDDVHKACERIESAIADMAAEVGR